MASIDVCLHALRTGHSPAAGTASARRAGLTWPRLPAAAELATIGAGYAAYALVRLAIRAGHQAAFAHAAWLCLRRPAAFPRLRAALVLATTGANVVFWTWPVAPPRFSVPGMTDVLVTHDILGAADPRGPSSLVNLYAAMPSLHVAWAAWCAVAIVITTRSRWRHLAWLYPCATTFVVLASANHFLLDIAGGVAIAGFGMLAAGRKEAVAAPGTGAQTDERRARRPIEVRWPGGKEGLAR